MARTIKVCGLRFMRNEILCERVVSRDRSSMEIGLARCNSCEGKKMKAKERWVFSMLRIRTSRKMVLHRQIDSFCSYQRWCFCTANMSSNIYCVRSLCQSARMVRPYIRFTGSSEIYLIGMKTLAVGFKNRFPTLGPGALWTLKSPHIQMLSAFSPVGG